MQSNSAERNFLLVEVELEQERASALGRAGRKLEEQFHRCRHLAQQIDGESDPAHARELRLEYNQARTAFEECRWKVCVQREAIGLHDHRWVDRVYPMPPRR